MCISKRALKALFFECDPRTTAEYKAAAASCNNEIPRAELDEAAETGARAALFAHAQAVHAQLMNGFATLDKKAEEAFKFTAGLMAATVALTTAAQLRFSIWLLIAVGLWFAAATVFGLMRRGVSIPGLPDALSVRDGIFCVDSFEEWMVNSIHKVSVAVRVLNGIRSEQLDLGIALLYSGLGFLLAHCIALYVATVI